MALINEMDSYGDLPRKADFGHYNDYIDALGKYLDVVVPLGERAYKLRVQYLRISYTPEEFAETAALFRQQIRQHEPDITDEEIDHFIEALKPQWPAH